jgi:hypothetical protein
VVNNIDPLMYVPVLVVMPLIMMIISLVKKEKPGEQPLKLE